MPRFKKGQPPGPGRPTGSRNKTAPWREAVTDEDTDKVIRVVHEHAVQGDMRAASIMLARTWPHHRGRAIPLDLPTVETTGGLVQAQAAVVAAMAKGEITPAEAASVASVLEAQRRAIETNDHEKRLQEIEEALKAKSHATPDFFP
jgi:hypothetical protein